MWIGKDWCKPSFHTNRDRLHSTWCISEVGFFLRSEGYPKKSSPASYALGEIPFGKNWPTSGMTINRFGIGVLYTLGCAPPGSNTMAKCDLWPTPRAANPGSRPNGKGGKILEEEILISVGQRSRGGKANPVSGSLNPDWVEWLMGYPRGWTVEGRCGSI